MYWNCKIMYFVGLLILCLFSTAKSLHCSSCNVSTSQFDDNACQGLESSTKCASNSVCLSANYEVNMGTVKTHATMRTCFLNMAGQECEYFIKNQKVMLYRTASIVPRTCYTCENDNCNKRIHNNNLGNNSGRSISKYLQVFISSIICLCIFRIFK